MNTQAVRVSALLLVASTELGVAVLINSSQFAPLPYTFALSLVLLLLPGLLALWVMRHDLRFAAPKSWTRTTLVATGCLAVPVAFVWLIGPDYIVSWDTSELLRLAALNSVETFIAWGILFGGLLLALRPLTGNRRLLAYFVVTLFFGAWHIPLEGVSALLTSIPFAVASCVAYDLTGNLLAPISLHIANDFGATVLPSSAITAQGLVVTPALFQVVLLLSALALSMFFGWKNWQLERLPWRDAEAALGEVCRL